MFHTYGGRRKRKNRSEVKAGLALLSSVAKLKIEENY